MGYDLRSRQVNPDTQRPERFRFNVSGMARLRAVLYELGVLDVDSPCPEWPVHPGQGHFDENDHPLTQEGRLYLERLQKVREWHANNGKVPKHKFASNNGWIVTPEECRIFSKAIRSAGKEVILTILQEYEEESPIFLEESADYIMRFGEYCERCASLGGFEVY